MESLKVYLFLLREGHTTQSARDLLANKKRLIALRSDFYKRREDYRDIVNRAVKAFDTSCEGREGGLIQQCTAIIDEIDKLLKELSSNTHIVTVEGLPIYIEIHNAEELSPEDIERLKEIIAKDVSLCLEDYFPPRR